MRCSATCRCLKTWPLACGASARDPSARRSNPSQSDGVAQAGATHWLADRRPSQLSGGQRQRIALARALAVGRGCCCWTSRLARWTPKVRKELRRWLHRRHDELHVTQYFVTHDQEEALEVADRVVLMNHGQIEQTGSPQIMGQTCQPVCVWLGQNVNLFGTARIHGGSCIGQEGSALSIRTPHLGDAHNVRAFTMCARTVGCTTQRAGCQGMPAQLTRTMVAGVRWRSSELHPLGTPGLASGAVIRSPYHPQILSVPKGSKKAIFCGLCRAPRVFVDQAACI